MHEVLIHTAVRIPVGPVPVSFRELPTATEAMADASAHTARHAAAIRLPARRGCRHA